MRPKVFVFTDVSLFMRCSV